MVKAARAQGDMRVLSGEAACLARDEVVKKMMQQMVGKGMKEMMQHPFPGSS